MKQCSQCDKDMTRGKDIARLAHGHTNCIECAERDESVELRTGLMDEEGNMHMTTRSALSKLKETETGFKKQRRTYRNQL